MIFPGKLRALHLRAPPAMSMEARISYKSWAALTLSAALLLLFAFLVTQQIPERTATEGAVNTVSGKSSHDPTEVADQAKDVAPQNSESTSRTEESAESTVKELVQAWNHGDANKIAELFLSDAVLRLPTGAEIKSRDEIKNTIAKHHDGMLKETKLTNTIEGVSTNGDSAVVRGNYQLLGIKVLGLSTSSTGTYEFHGTKRDGRWLIAKAEVTRE